MSAKLDYLPELLDTPNKTRMVHLAHVSCYRAYCGAVLQGIEYPAGTPLDCLVCIELDLADARICPDCGESVSR